MRLVLQEHLGPGVTLDLGELEVVVENVKVGNILGSWRSQNFHYFN